jgi:uncharacterized protein YqgV (UPF0045/DUF77 family)
MQATVELSLNPLDADYANIVTEFILRFKDHPDLQVVVNGLSTQIIGPYDLIMDMLEGEMKTVLEKYPAVFHMKIARGRLTRDGLPDSLL